MSSSLHPYRYWEEDVYICDTIGTILVPFFNSIMIPLPFPGIILIFATKDC